MMRGFYGPGSDFLARGDFWWMGLGSMIVHFIFWIAIIYLVVKFVNKYFNRVDETKIKENTAMSILRERYARGEIDSEEFKQKKADLE